MSPSHPPLLPRNEYFIDRAYQQNVAIPRLGYKRDTRKSIDVIYARYQPSLRKTAGDDGFQRGQPVH
jgi:hypothetical protein